MKLFSGLLGAPRADAAVEPSGTSMPEAWLTDLFGGVVTATGLRVTVRDALTVPGIAACIQVLSEDIAKVPFVLNRKGAGATRKPAVEHPLYTLLASRPAPWLSSFDWRRSMVHTALSRGNGHSRIHRDDEGRVLRLGLIQPGRVTTRWTDEGEPFYDLTAAQGPMRQGLSFQDVLHLAYRGSNDFAENGGIIGVSPIQQHREAIALAIAAERFAARFFANGARPSIAIEMEKKLPNDAVAKRLRAQIEGAYSGMDNAFRVAILELGMKLKEFSYNNRDSQLIEVRKEQAVQCCTMFGVPPHKIGILDRATNNNIEHQGIDYVTGPVSSLARAVESAVRISCLTADEDEEFEPELDLDDLQRGDILSRYRSYAIGRQWGWLNADEIREWESMNPLPDGAGKTYLTPLNMVPAGEDPMKDDAAKPAAPPANNPDGDQA
ncbi:phage portal protein [Ancylobacter defluvii]|uniref:Portal protein n=1 Tax=Ancylobacter defluvii TaxID=1282440 RepID=A0A9W6K0I9_9HYPH|nr:phage portal protein [Ancylobacter defluvii]MBS7588281.1 phage portal protein [Ancylobacter defluvii]GLK86677.1 portal protein [Ancylobacter defluvii]